MPHIEEDHPALPYQERLEKRVRLLESKAHEPVETYTTATIDSKIRALLHRIEILEANQEGDR